MTRTPSYKFSLSFPGKIWQTVLDEANGIWLLEVREPDAQKITYYLIYLKTYQQEEIVQIEGADWWTVILRLHWPVLLLERYNDPQNPVDKDLILYDAEKQKVVATLREFQFEAYSDNVIKGSNPADQNQKKTFELSDIGIGVPNTERAEIHYPVYFPPVSENIKVVHDFLQIAPSGLGCEYFEAGGVIIISYYVRLDRKFDRKLLVLQEDAELCHELQDRNLTGYASGAFFLFENLLVYIKNGNQINGIEL